MHKLFWVSCFILLYIVGKAVCQSKNSQGTLENPKVDSDPLAAVTDVKKFVEEIIKKTSEVVLSEVTSIVCVLLSFQVHVSSSLIKLPIKKNTLQIQHEEQQRPGARKRLSADLENLTVSEKYDLFLFCFLFLLLFSLLQSLVSIQELLDAIQNPDCLLVCMFRK